MSKKIKIETAYGTMTFPSWIEAYEFRDTIATWNGFTEKTRPIRVEQAVAYHLAYCEGGVREVRALIREYQQEAREERQIGGFPPELIGQPAEVVKAEWDRRMQAGWLGW